MKGNNNVTIRDHDDSHFSIDTAHIRHIIPANRDEFKENYIAI